MRYSVALPHPTQGQGFSDPDVLAEIACAIDATGLDACAVMDHPFPLLEHPEAGGQALDIFALAGYLAAATSRLIVHLNVIVMGYRNPFLVARAVSTLDHLAKGRLMVGIGAGYMKAEFDALGADFSQRGELVDEGVVALKTAWSGEPVTLEAALWSVRGNSMMPPPLTAPHPKLFRGGNSKKAIESAVRHFDGWNPFEAPRGLASEANTAPIASLEDLRQRITFLRETEERLERPNPLELSLNRPDPRWLLPSRDAVVAELEQLAELGIDWIVTYLPGSTKAEVVERVHSLAETVAVSPRTETKVSLTSSE